MAVTIKQIDYKSLDARQRENFNFMKLSAVLADYGFVTMRLSADWQGADFIAQHVDGQTFLKVQLKSRLAFGKMYEGKDLYMAFRHRKSDAWYLFPHDKVLRSVLAGKRLAGTRSWDQRGGYSFASLGKDLLALLEPYRIGHPERRVLRLK